MEKETGPLKKIPLFANFSEAMLAEFAGAFRRRSYSAGDVIFAEGSEGDTLFILLSGQVAIEKKLDEEGKCFKPLAFLSDGEFFGEMSVLEKQARFAQARAATDCSLYEVRRGEFFSFVKAHPENGMAIFTEILRVLSRRLQHTSSELTMLFDMSRLVLRAHGSAAEFVKSTVEEISIYFEGDWNFKGFAYNQFSGEYELAVAKEKFPAGPEKPLTGEAESGWLDGRSYRMVFRAGGRPAGCVLFTRSAEVSGYERNALSTIFDTVSSIMGSAIENLDHRAEAAMLEKLNMRKNYI